MIAFSHRALFCISVMLAFLLPVSAQAQPSAAASSRSSVLMRHDVVGMPGKEVVVSTVDLMPGVPSRAHRHNAQVFVYVLQGTVRMQVKGGPLLTLGPGQTFYEGPDDIHTVGDDVSRTEPAKILVVMIKDKGKPSTTYVNP